jgi:colanic acid/amylovoran biosynthesis glycosyltransferase
MMVRRLNGTPYSLVVNANLDWWGGAMREKLGEAALIVTHARWLLDQVHRDYPDIPECRLIQASVGVDPERWQPPISASTRHTGCRVVAVGRLHASKGHDVLIRAVDLLRRDGQAIDLRILGAGPSEGELRDLIDNLGCGGHVQLLGSRSEDDVISEFGQADIFALASHAEPLGVVFMEAMAMGLPVVGTRAGGVAEVIVPDQTGLLVPPGDVVAMADALRRLAAEPDTRRRFGQAGRERAVNVFDSRHGAVRLRDRLLRMTEHG